MDGCKIEEVAANAGASVQTMSRWTQEAYEGHDWFIEALAQHLGYSIFAMQDEIDSALEGVFNICSLIGGYRSLHSVMPVMDRVVTEFAHLAARSAFDDYKENGKKARQMTSAVLERLAAEFRDMSWHDN